MRPSIFRHCSKYCRSVSCHLRFALRPGIPTNRLTYLLARAGLLLLQYAHDTSSISVIAGVFHPCAFRRNLWARSLVLYGTLVATRNSNNVRSSDSVKTIRIGAGIRKTASVQKTHLFYLTFYCSRLLMECSLCAHSNFYFKHLCHHIPYMLRRSFICTMIPNCSKIRSHASPICA